MPVQPSRGQSPAQRLVIEGFAGGLHSQGVFTKTAILETECVSALNVEFYPVGVVAKRRGRLNKSPLNGPCSDTAIKAIYQWWNPAGAQFLLAFTCASGTVSGDVYTWTASGGDGYFTSVLSGDMGLVSWNPSYDGDINIESFTGSAVFVDGTDPLWAYDGVGSGAYIEAAPSGAKFVKSFRSTLFVANHKDNTTGQRLSSTVTWSNPHDLNVWPPENYIDLDPDDGDEIKGLAVIGSELFVFKEKKIYAISYVGGIYSYYSEVRIEDKGCSASRSIVQQYGEIIFYGIDAFYSFDGRKLADLSVKIKDYVLNINAVYRNFVYGGFYREKSQVWFLVPYLDAARNNYCFVYDRDRQNWSIFSHNCASIGFYQNVTDLIIDDLPLEYDEYDITWGDRTFLSNSTTLVTGTYDGYLLDNDTAGVTSDNTADYKGIWKSKWIDFAEPDFNKRILRITILVNVETHENLKLKVFKDWDETNVIHTETISLTGVAGLTTIEKRIDFTHYLRAMQLEFSTDFKAEPFMIHKIVIEYIPKGRTKV